MGIEWGQSSQIARRLAAAVAAPLCCGLIAGVAAAGAAESTPIKHVVVILQENHSFDNVLGKLCIQDERPECDAAASGKNEKGETIPLSKASDVVPPVDHSQESQLKAMDGGKMDGWERVEGCEKRACYTAFEPSQIPSLAALARAGAISDSFFSRDIVPSWGGHLDFFAQTLDGFVGNNPKYDEGAPPEGSGWGCDSNRDAIWVEPITHRELSEPSCIPNKNGEGPYRPSPVAYVPTIADRMEEAGKTWGIYGALSPTTKTKHRGPYKWAICPTFAECLYGPQKNDMHEASKLLADARKGKLPNFAIATPSAGKNGTVTGSTSQHNGTSMLTGDNWIGEEVSAIQNGPDGPSTTIFIYYDDCGCFYDHVTPPEGLGIRLPLVIVSPYAKKGFTDGNEATNSSILAYAESVLGVAPVDEQDALAYDFHEAFDYSQTPTPPFQFHAAAVPRASQHLPEPPPDDT